MLKHQPFKEYDYEDLQVPGDAIIDSDNETDESYEPGKENIKTGKRKKATPANKSKQNKNEAKKNISLNKKNKRGETALHCACIKVTLSL